MIQLLQNKLSTTEKSLSHGQQVFAVYLPLYLFKVVNMAEKKLLDQLDLRNCLLSKVYEALDELGKLGGIQSLICA